MTTSASFLPGPALSPSEPLLAWLQASGGESRKLLRLPVVITFSNPGRFAIGTAYIGTAPAAPGSAPPADAILLKLDGAGLSVALVEQVRAKCETAMSCALWVDGLWGPRIGSDPLGGMPAPAGPTRWPFAVVEVGDAVDAAATTTGFIENP